MKKTIEEEIKKVWDKSGIITRIDMKQGNIGQETDMLIDTAIKVIKKDYNKKVEKLKKEIKPFCVSTKAHKDVCIMINKIFKK